MTVSIAMTATSAQTLPAMPLLVVHQITKAFGTDDRRIRALHSVSLEVAAGEIVCIVGPSGSGKSTILRIIAGLTQADSGSVRIRGEAVTAPHPAMGMVFQRTNLMPWRTVLANVLLPLEVRQGRLDAEDRRRGQRMLHLVGLEGFEDVYPKHLSGGMAQRAVLARTLLQAPDLLLLDEPFGALDALTRERLNVELLRLHSLHAQTTILVTHSINEAVFLADRIIVISRRPGRIMATLAVDLPRPRDLAIMGTPEFAALTQQVRRCIDAAEG